MDLVDALLGVSQSDLKKAQKEAAILGSKKLDDDALLGKLMQIDGGDIPTPEEVTINQLEESGVDVETGGDMSTRAAVSAFGFSPRRQLKYLQDEFGSKNVRETKAGFVIKKDGQETLLDERGFTFKDLADLVDEGVVVAAAIPAAIAAAGATTSVAVIAAAAALAGQTAGGMKDVLAALKQGGLTFDEFGDIVKERGWKAAVDFGLDLLTGGAAKLTGGAVKRVVSPFGSAGDEAVQKEVSGAAQRQGIALTGAEKTGSETLARAETIARKVPGSSGTFNKIDSDNAIRTREIVNGLAENAPNPEIVGDAVTRVIDSGFEGAKRGVNDLRLAAEARSMESLGGIGRNINEAPVGPSQGGAAIRAAIIEAHSKATEEASRRFNKVLGDKRVSGPIISAKPLKTLVSDLIKEFPTQGGEAAEAFLPNEAKRFFTSLSALDNMNLQQAIRARSQINEFIKSGQVNAGVGQGVLKKISAELTNMIDSGIKGVKDKELRDNLLSANKYYKDEVLKFNEPGLGKLFKQPNQPGYLEDRDVIQNFFLRDSLEELVRIRSTLGPESPEFRLARRAAFDSILLNAQDILQDGVIDGRKLAAQLNRLSVEQRKIIFGSDADNITQVARELFANKGKLDISKIENTKGDVGSLLRQAMEAEAQASKDYKNKFIAPLLRGDIDSASIRPRDFTRHFLDQSSYKDVVDFMQRIGEQSPLATDIKKSVVMELLSRSGHIDDGIKRFIGRDNPVGPNLLQIIKDVGEDKVKKILGPESYLTLRDLGIIAAAQNQKREAAASAGGLVSGTIISGIATGGLGALPDIIKYRVVGALLTNPVMRKWLGSTAKTPSAGKVVRGSIVASPQVIEAISSEFAEDSELAQHIITTLNNLKSRGQ